MLDINKSYDFFKPTDCKGNIHIIGCGAVGSTVAENLARTGITKFTLWDFDNVESHNIANQMFRDKDIGKPKVGALAEIMCDINPAIKDDLVIKNKPYKNEPISGYIFLCVDNIDVRREIAEFHKNNNSILAMFDFRIGLTTAQHYAADWTDYTMKNEFIKSMQFSHEEAQQNTQVSACNMTLSIVPTVRVVCSVGVANFINFINYGEIASMVLLDPFKFDIFKVS